MTPLPLISIVVPSLNQGEFLGETLQSLVDQNYPRLEVIIQDGGSTDASIAVAQDFARRYPDVFHLHVEADRGQSHALNLGFAKTHGEILGFLNSDDTLYPDCLQSVAREIDPARDRWIVFGRCLFVGEGSPLQGVEHPAEFVSRFEQLAIWQRGFNTLPQPSVFWHRRVWTACGGFDERETHVLDYDLFCRFSAKFQFHKVDELWSTYRLHPASKSAQRSESEVLALAVATSRRHWPGWWHPLRWRLAWSYRRHDRHLHERACHHARRAEKAFADRHTAPALGEFFRVALLSPAMAWHRLLQPILVGRGLHLAEKWLFRRGPHDALPGEFTGRHADGWIGPYYEETLLVPAGARRLVLVIQHSTLGGLHPQLTVELFLEERSQARVTCAEPGRYELKADLHRHAGHPCRLTLHSLPYFVPSLVIDGSTDDRRLCTQLVETRLESAGIPAAPATAGAAAGSFPP